MIILKLPLNHRGTLIDAGTPVGFLPAERQEQLVKNGAAEIVEPEKQETKKDSPSDGKTVNELVTIIESANSEDELKFIFQSELAGKKRKSVFEAIEVRMEKIKNPDGESNGSGAGNGTGSVGV